MTAQTVLRSKGQLTIPAEVREATHLKEGDPVTIEVVEGTIVLYPGKVIDASQAWFWTAEWQENVRRSLAEVQSGETVTLTEDEFLGALDES